MQRSRWCNNGYSALSHSECSNTITRFRDRRHPRPIRASSSLVFVNRTWYFNVKRKEAKVYIHCQFWVLWLYMSANWCDAHCYTSPWSQNSDARNPEAKSCSTDVCVFCVFVLVYYCVCRPCFPHRIGMQTVVTPTQLNLSHLPINMHKCARGGVT